MAYTQPVVGSFTLPNPSSYREKRAYRGAGVEMADGSMQMDIVNDSVKHTYALTWKNISDADMAIIRSAYDSLKIASAAFTPLSGEAATNVTRTNDEPTFDAVNTPAGLRWSGSLELREV